MSIQLRLRGKQTYVFTLNWVGFLGLISSRLGGPFLSRPKNMVAAYLSTKFHPRGGGIEPILESGMSLVRWGDGDSMSAAGLSNNYEASNLSLARELRASLSIAPHTNVILAMPYEVLLPEFRKNRTRSSLVTWNLTLVVVALLVRRPVSIFDSFIFKSLDSVQSLFAHIHSRNIIFLGPQTTLELVRHYFPHLKIKFVPVPERFGFSSADSIEEGLIATLNDTSDPIVLVSAGSLGRVLILRHASRAQFVDVGALSPLRAMATG